MKFIYVFGFALSCYLVYRNKNMDRKKNNLLVVHSKSKLSKFFKLITDHFLENYAEGLFYSGHAQTFLLELLDRLLKFFKNYLNFFKFKYKSELFKLSDGGTVSVNFAKCIDKKHRNKNKILVVFPGFTSEAEEYYIKNFLNDFVEEFDCRVVNARGVGIKLTSPIMISTYCHKDVREYLEFVCNTNPDKKVFAVGFSFGGMMLARCLGSQEKNNLPPNLIGGCGLCYPICLKSVKNHVEPQLGGLYSKFGSRNLRRCFLENVDIIFSKDSFLLHEKEQLIERVKNLTHVSEFDEIYTYKSLKFKNTEDYYADSNLTNYLENIKVPFLSIFTKDDPIIPYEAIPLKTYQKNPNLITIASNKGGHMGFFTGLLPQRWIDIPIKTYLKTVEIIHEVEDFPFNSSSKNSSCDIYENIDISNIKLEG